MRTIEKSKDPETLHKIGRELTAIAKMDRLKGNVHSGFAVAMSIDGLSLYGIGFAPEIYGHNVIMSSPNALCIVAGCVAMMLVARDGMQAVIHYRVANRLEERAVLYEQAAGERSDTRLEVTNGTSTQQLTDELSIA